jgi:hypothetical protein
MESTHARQLLEAERQRLLGVRAAQDVEAPLTEPVTSNTEELSSVDQHLADIGTETFSREVDASIREEINSELAEIDAAMWRTLPTASARRAAVRSKRNDSRPFPGPDSACVISSSWRRSSGPAAARRR